MSPRMISISWVRDRPLPFSFVAVPMVAMGLPWSFRMVKPASPVTLDLI